MSDTQYLSIFIFTTFTGMFYSAHPSSIKLKDLQQSGFFTIGRVQVHLNLYLSPRLNYLRLSFGEWMGLEAEVVN